MDDIFNATRTPGTFRFEFEHVDRRGKVSGLAIQAVGEQEAKQIAQRLPRSTTAEFKAEFLRDLAADQRRAKNLQLAMQDGGPPICTMLIIGINILVYLAMVGSGAGILSVRSDKALAWGADYWPLTTGGQWWRLLTCAFVHFGCLHLLFNMYAFYLIGLFAESLFGRRLYLLVYVYGALASSLVSIWWEPHAVTAGASGAIFAVFGAVLADLLFHKRDFPRAFFSNVWFATVFFTVINLVAGLGHEGTSNSAHIGGLLAGMLMGAVVARPLELARRRSQLWPRFAAGVVLSGSSLLYAAQQAQKNPPSALSRATESVRYSIPDPVIHHDFAPGPVAPVYSKDMFNEGVKYLNGTGVKQNYGTALTWFRKAAGTGSTPAMDALGTMYANGQGITQDYTAAVNWYQKAAQARLPIGMYNLANMYYLGHGVPQDYPLAMVWYRGAADARLPQAMNNVAFMFASGQGTRQDYELAMAWYRKAAAAGSPIAMNNIGTLYLNGQGTPRNVMSAMDWFIDAANAGCDDGMRNLGTMYRLGTGVKQDDSQAVAWYQKAVDAGNVIAMRLLAECYTAGNGVNRDDAKARSLYNTAAERGDALSRQWLEAHPQSPS